MKTLTEQNRFWSKVVKAGHDECWLWTGSRAGGRLAKTGDWMYGTFRTSSPRATCYAHRYAFAFDNSLHFSEIPKGLVVRHSCDNPLCCNPKHLLLGTQKQNMEDMVKSGRQRKGAAAPGAKLTPPRVLEIRQLAARGLFHHDIAEMFGICRTNVTNIANRKVWAWL